MLRRLDVPWRTVRPPWTASSCRSFAFADHVDEMLFRVKGDGVDVAKLAGGIYLRSKRKQDTFLEGMGDRSIENCVRGLVLANKFAEKHRKEGDPENIPWFHRLAFAPQLRKRSDLYWISLKVIPLESPYQEGEGTPGDRLRVGRKAEVQGLARTFMTSWTKRCLGQSLEPCVRCMGAENVSLAVKGLARCLKDMSDRKGALRLFVCYPEMLQETLQESGDTVTMTQIRIEPRPRN